MLGFTLPYPEALNLGQWLRENAEKYVQTTKHDGKEAEKTAKEDHKDDPP